MHYAIISEDVANSLPLRLQHRDAHIERLKLLAGQGRLLCAGPHPAADTEDFKSAGVSGSLIVAEFESLEAAKAWADQDPYVLGGVHASVTVKPFLRVLP
ncbi:MAG: YciI family protein [Gammaproteobacteria bacterium]|nr:YciI family protein [Gammaproteobacteria bacterium]NND38787.1 YciI family protein [Pseudomonadales bacterium]MBT8151862.1 YciI family protein [Gammaproteobacteria bacterium]NNL10926.1 YciI family protein [Pseudomonadales bacterium]NNM10867.1 YciI family protein [Pseudomonadales bacterium]